MLAWGVGSRAEEGGHWDGDGEESCPWDAGDEC